MDYLEDEIEELVEQITGEEFNILCGIDGCNEAILEAVRDHVKKNVYHWKEVARRPDLEIIQTEKPKLMGIFLNEKDLYEKKIREDGKKNEKTSASIIIIPAVEEKIEDVKQEKVEEIPLSTTNLTESQLEEEQEPALPTDPILEAAKLNFDIKASVNKQDLEDLNRIKGLDLRGKDFHVSTDGSCPRCGSKWNVFVILDSLFPAGDMPEILQTLLTQGKAILWSSKQNMKCKDPPTFLCGGNCPFTDIKKCGFNLDWSLTDLEQIFLSPPKNKEDLKENNTEVAEVEEGGEEDYWEDDDEYYGDEGEYYGDEGWYDENGDYYDGYEDDEEVYDEGMVDIDHYRKKVSWFVLDEHVVDNSKIPANWKDMIRTMLALELARDDFVDGKMRTRNFEKAVIEISSSDEKDEKSSKNDAKMTTTQIVAGDGSSFKTDKDDSNQIQNKPLKSSKTNAEIHDLDDSGKIIPPEVITIPDDKENRKRSDSKETEKPTKRQEQKYWKTPQQYEQQYNQQQGSWNQSQQHYERSKQDKKITADSFPISSDGSCPYCYSRNVIYIILKDGIEDRPIPELLARLKNDGLAEWRIKGDHEWPSFQCLGCTYGFNLDWSVMDLEKIFYPNEYPVKMTSSYDASTTSSNSAKSTPPNTYYLAYTANTKHVTSNSELSSKYEDTLFPDENSANSMSNTCDKEPTSADSTSKYHDDGKSAADSPSKSYDDEATASTSYEDTTSFADSTVTSDKYAVSTPYSHVSSSSYDYYSTSATTTASTYVASQMSTNTSFQPGFMPNAFPPLPFLPPPFAPMPVMFPPAVPPMVPPGIPPQLASTLMNAIQTVSSLPNTSTMQPPNLQATAMQWNHHIPPNFWMTPPPPPVIQIPAPNNPVLVRSAIASNLQTSSQISAAPTLQAAKAVLSKPPILRSASNTMTTPTQPILIPSNNLSASSSKILMDATAKFMNPSKQPPVLQSSKTATSRVSYRSKTIHERTIYTTSPTKDSEKKNSTDDTSVVDMEVDDSATGSDSKMDDTSTDPKASKNSDPNLISFFGVAVPKPDNTSVKDVPQDATEKSSKEVSFFGNKLVLGSPEIKVEPTDVEKNTSTLTQSTIPPAEFFGNKLVLGSSETDTKPIDREKSGSTQQAVRERGSQQAVEESTVDHDPVMTASKVDHPIEHTGTDPQVENTEKDISQNNGRLNIPFFDTSSNDINEDAQKPSPKELARVTRRSTRRKAGDRIPEVSSTQRRKQTVDATKSKQAKPEPEISKQVSESTSSMHSNEDKAKQENVKSLPISTLPKSSTNSEVTADQEKASEPVVERESKRTSTKKQVKKMSLPFVCDATEEQEEKSTLRIANDKKTKNDENDDVGEEVMKKQSVKHPVKISSLPFADEPSQPGSRETRRQTRARTPIASTPVHKQESTRLKTLQTSKTSELLQKPTDADMDKKKSERIEPTCISSFSISPKVDTSIGETYTSDNQNVESKSVVDTEINKTSKSKPKKKINLPFVSDVAENQEKKTTPMTLVDIKKEMVEVEEVDENETSEGRKAILKHQVKISSFPFADEPKQQKSETKQKIRQTRTRTAHASTEVKKQVSTKLRISEPSEIEPPGKVIELSIPESELPKSIETREETAESSHSSSLCELSSSNKQRKETSPSGSLTLGLNKPPAKKVKKKMSLPFVSDATEELEIKPSQLVTDEKKSLTKLDDDIDDNTKKGHSKHPVNVCLPFADEPIKPKAEPQEHRKRPQSEDEELARQQMISKDHKRSTEGTDMASHHRKSYQIGKRSYEEGDVPHQHEFRRQPFEESYRKTTLDARKRPIEDSESSFLKIKHPRSEVSSILQSEFESRDRSRVCLPFADDIKFENIQKFLSDDDMLNEGVALGIDGPSVSRILTNDGSGSGANSPFTDSLFNIVSEEPEKPDNESDNNSNITKISENFIETPEDDKVAIKQTRRGSKRGRRGRGRGSKRVDISNFF